MGRRRRRRSRGRRMWSWGGRRRMRRKMDNIDVILGVMEDAESIYDISKIQNGRLNQKWPYFNS